MNEHVFEELPRLLSGDADRATVDVVVAHLRDCTDCRDELISSLVAHAALMSSVRYAPDLAARDVTDNDASAVPVAPSAGLAPLPDLGPVFAEIRREIAEADAARVPAVVTSIDRPRRHTRAVRYGLVAAAVSIGLAGGGVYIAEHNGSSGPPARAVALDAYGIGKTTASARLVDDDEMIVSASSLPSLHGDSYYEVWLTNGARTAMAPVGQLNAQGKGTFVVPTNVISTYAAIEVSVQTTHGVGSYSGVSVLRGSYA